MIDFLQSKEGRLHFVPPAYIVCMKVMFSVVSVHIGAIFVLPSANEVWGKVIFLHLSVILFTGEGGVPGQVYPPLRPGTPPGTRYTPGNRYTPWDQVHPPGTRYTPQDQVYPPGPGTPPWTRYTTPGPGTPPWTRYPPRNCARWEIWATSGQYASYWNAFLLPHSCIMGYATWDPHPRPVQTCSLGDPLPYYMDTWDLVPPPRPVETCSTGDPQPLTYLQVGGWPSTERPSCNIKLAIILSFLTVSLNFN